MFGIGGLFGDTAGGFTGGAAGPSSAAGSGGNTGPNVGGIGSVVIGGFKSDGSAAVTSLPKIALAVAAVVVAVVIWRKLSK